MLKKRKTKEVQALGHISMSAHKARRVIDQIRGRSYEETLMILDVMPYQASCPILKIVFYAGANASYTMGSNKTNLIISKAEVNEGTAVKKFKPRARGRSYPIKRPTCHISIVVKDISLDEYIETITRLKKPRWKNKDTNRIYHNMDSSGGVWGQNKSTWFQTGYNARSSFPLVCTTKKLFRRSRRRSKNTRFY